MNDRDPAFTGSLDRLAAPAAHKETKHYQTWRDTVASMMAEPRQSVKFGNVLPEDGEW